MDKVKQNIQLAPEAEEETFELMDVSGMDFSMALVTTDNGSSAYSDDVKTHGVPGYDNEEYVEWGENNDEPYEIMKLIRADEVTAQNSFFMTKLCYGAGLQLQDPETKLPTVKPDLVKWIRRNRIAHNFLGMCQDMKHWFFAVAVIILSKDGKTINRIVRKEACHCRVSPYNVEQRYVYYADWRKQYLSKDDVERIPLLDEDDPTTDLMQRMGCEPGAEGLHEDTSEERKFAVVIKYPTTDGRYYPVPIYTAAFRGGSYNQLRLIAKMKEVMMKNSTSVKYLIEIHRGYWQRVINEARISDPVKQAVFVKKRKEVFKNYVCGLDNKGKALITEYYVDPQGHEEHDVKITLIESKKEGGDWNEDISTAANIVCYVFGIHPNLAGASPGKSQSNNSGSDKRELLSIAEILEISFHDILKDFYYLVVDYNNYDLEVAIPLLLPTTLDQHKDVKKVTP